MAVCSFRRQLLRTFSLRFVERQNSSSKQDICPGKGQIASLYIHWPFCEKRCTYCNFNKYIHKNEDLQRFAACLKKETSTLLQLSGASKIVSVFFGGGTPSLAPPSAIESILEVVYKDGYLSGDAEVTLEVNPTTAEVQKLRQFKAAGINRLSVGVQALNSDDLKLLGRNHTVTDSNRCVDIARTFFPGKVSIDVIFGRPKQTEEQWQEELGKVLRMADDHISLYQLTLERGTALFKQVMDRNVLMLAPDSVAQMYNDAVQVLADNGFHRYEASNFSRTLDAESTHNKWYWSGGDYIGSGPGAHGRFTPIGSSSREARIQTLEPTPWMIEVEAKGHATRKTVPLTPLQVLEEYLVLSLRTTRGLCSKKWSKLSPGLPLLETFDEAAIVKTLQSEGFLLLTKDGLQATDKGLNVIDSITPELLNVLGQQWEMHYS